MKMDPARIESFLKNPGSTSIILIYGPDSGLVSERAQHLVKSVLGNTDDPFRYAEITDSSRLLEEATAASLTGGRRVVRLRDAGDAAAKPTEALLKNAADALVILEAGDLTPKSKLRALAEKSQAAAAIACYAVDAARLPRIIAERLRAQNIGIETEAASWVSNNITGEEGAIRQAVELLTLYAGPAGRQGGAPLTLTDVTAALADGGETSIQDAIDATLTGNPQAADRAITLAFDEGVSPVALIRVLLGELMRLRVAASQLGPNTSIQEAVSSLRPPVFFKRVPIFTRALSLWPQAALTETIRLGLAAEAACKSTHTPDQAYCRQMLLGLASKARAASRR
jgi:DNA polymerase-3 subunit delta